MLARLCIMRFGTFLWYATNFQWVKGTACTPKSDITFVQNAAKRSLQCSWMTGIFTLLLRKSAQANPIIKTVGYKATESAFSPARKLYVTPVLPQSALLNTLSSPLDCELVGQIQAYLESYAQLLNPTARQKRQVAQDSSALWSNLRINAQRAAGMLFYNQQLLMTPAVQDGEVRYPRALAALEALKEDLVELVSAAQASNVTRCLVLIQTGLNRLHSLALDLSTSTITDEALRSGDAVESRSGVPLRSTMLLTFRLLGPRRTVAAEGDHSLVLPDATPLTDYLPGSDHTVEIVVDAANYPVTSAAILHLCARRHFEGLPVALRPLEVGGSNRTYTATILGDYALGSVDPVTGRQQRIPLEILREEASLLSPGRDQGRYRTGRRRTTLGGAQNSAVFTRAQPVQSFSTYGAIGAYHNKSDLNGASAALFWLPYNHSSSASSSPSAADLRRLNSQYALFAYVVKGGGVLLQLQPGDLCVGCQVQAERTVYSHSFFDTRTVQWKDTIV